jgi:hypothetical protein
LRTGGVIVCIALCACGSGGSSASDGGAVDAKSPSLCNVVISGAFTSGFGCAQAASLDKASGVTLHTITGGGPANIENFFMSVQIAGPPQVHSYDASNVVAANASVLTTTNIWSQQTGAMAMGSFSLNPKSVTNEYETSTAAYYLIHGSWSATLPEKNGDGGTDGPITVVVTY